jgi:hypothetical protein
MAKGLDPPHDLQAFPEVAPATAGRVVGKELGAVPLEVGLEYWEVLVGVAQNWSLSLGFGLEWVRLVL